MLAVIEMGYKLKQICVTDKDLNLICSCAILLQIEKICNFTNKFGTFVAM